MPVPSCFLPCRYCSYQFTVMNKSMLFVFSAKYRFMIYMPVLHEADDACSRISGIIVFKRTVAYGMALKRYPCFEMTPIPNRGTSALIAKMRESTMAVEYGMYPVRRTIRIVDRTEGGNDRRRIHEEIRDAEPSNTTQAESEQSKDD